MPQETRVDVEVRNMIIFDGLSGTKEIFRLQLLARELREMQIRLDQ